jgi:SAM-dependent methyltransferase
MADPHEPSLDSLVRALRAALESAPLHALGGEDSDRLGLLSMELELRADVFNSRYSRRRVSDVFQMATRFREAGRFHPRGATVVELGCGAANPLATLLVHVLAGAEAAHGFDLRPPRDLVAAVRGLARVATYMLAEPALLAPGFGLDRAEVARNFEGFDLVRMWLGDPGGIDQQRLRLHQGSAASTGLATGSTDFAYSVSFLEHVDDPDAVVGELARITRSGGCGTHSIDGKDHWMYGNVALHPLEFLVEPGEPRLVHGSNRLRPHEFVTLFERHGFAVEELLVQERCHVPESLRERMGPRFRAMATADLEAVAGTIFVRRR